MTDEHEFYYLEHLNLHIIRHALSRFFFFFNDTATTEIYPLSLHDALPICNAGTLTAVLEARRAEIDTRVERLRLEMGAARLWAQLNYLVPAGHDTAAPRP